MTNKYTLINSRSPVLFYLFLFFNTLLSCSSNKENKQRFITEEQLKIQVVAQDSINAHKLGELKKFGVDEKSGISIDFFFVTDDSSKAINLTTELIALNYHLNNIHPSSGNQNLWVASGSSSRVNMELQSLNAWTDSLCNTGFRHDCAFNGWNPVTE